MTGSTCTTDQDMGLRTGEWLLALGSGPAADIEIAFDFQTDFALLERALRCGGQWDRLEVARVDVAVMSRSIEGSYLAEGCYRTLATRGLKRHHALADALALRAAYLGVTDTSVRMARVVHSDAFRRLVAMVAAWFDPAVRVQFDTEAWVHRWFLHPMIELDRKRPLDIVEEPNGPARLEECLRQVENGVCA